MKTIFYQSQHPTILFAVEELRRLVRKAGIPVNVHQGELESENEEEKIILQTVDEYNQSLVDEELDIDIDGFSIHQKNGVVWIIGAEERAVLYGVYHYCKNTLGYQWVDLEERRTKKSNDDLMNGFRETHSPIFKRRGNILETIDDPIYIKHLIDWGVKNGQNEMFFTFSLWDKVKKYILDDLVKRNVQVTLGGHSLNYLLKKSNHMVDQEERLNLFAKDNHLQDIVVQEVIAICSNDSVITRISLWPEDVGIDENNADEFIPSYIDFAEKLQNALKQADLNIDVEHIVYNAGLDWNMLERKANTRISNQLDVLYAYWGRDYSDSINSQAPHQKRAYDALRDWREQTAKVGTSFTILEYYSDHFMLSELFPPLLNRINNDVKDYQNIGVDGLLNLIVPVHKKSDQDLLSRYPWKWIHHLNNFVYTRLSWGEDYSTILEEYFSSLDIKQFQQAIIDLEELIAPHTSFNVPLFPARIVDPEKVENTNLNLPMVKLLQRSIDYINDLDLSAAKSLHALQDKDNFQSFTAQEMIQFYFYYLKKIAEQHIKAWKSK